MHQDALKVSGDKLFYVFMQQLQHKYSTKNAENKTVNIRYRIKHNVYNLRHTVLDFNLLVGLFLLPKPGVNTNN